LFEVDLHLRLNFGSLKLVKFNGKIGSPNSL